MVRLRCFQLQPIASCGTTARAPLGDHHGAAHPHHRRPLQPRHHGYHMYVVVPRILFRPFFFGHPIFWGVLSSAFAACCFIRSQMLMTLLPLPPSAPSLPPSAVYPSPALAPLASFSPPSPPPRPLNLRRVCGHQVLPGVQEDVLCRRQEQDDDGGAVARAGRHLRGRAASSVFCCVQSTTSLERTGFYKRIGSIRVGRLCAPAPDTSFLFN